MNDKARKFANSFTGYVLSGIYTVEFLIFMLLFLSNFPLEAQELPDKASPFTAVKWEGATPIVKFEDEWYVFKQIDHITVEQLIEAAKEDDEEGWRKPFSEDMVELLGEMGYTPKVKVKLIFEKDGEVYQKTGNMTEENRRKVWSYNREHGIPEEMEREQDSDQKKTVNQLQEEIAKAVNPKKGTNIFKIKSVKIDYTITGNPMFAGEQTMYIDDWGNVVAIVSKKEGKGFIGAENKTTIWKDNQTTIYDHIKNEAWRTPVRPKDTEPPIIAISTEEQRKMGGYERLADEEIAGRRCQVYKHKTMNVTYWLWKGIDLKLVNYSLGKTGYTKEATAVNENISIPGDLLQLPSGYEWK